MRATLKGREREFHQVVVRVEHDQHGRFGAALAYSRRTRAPIDEHSKTLHDRICPIHMLHLRAIGVDPSDILDPQFRILDSGEEEVAAQHRIFVAQCTEFFHEGDQRKCLLVMFPVDPTDGIVLGIGIVVAVLCAPEFIAREQHRGALR